MYFLFVYVDCEEEFKIGIGQGESMEVESD